jgi:hypothetical protein
MLYVIPRSKEVMASEVFLCESVAQEVREIEAVSKIPPVKKLNQVFLFVQ